MRFFGDSHGALHYGHSMYRKQLWVMLIMVVAVIVGSAPSGSHATPGLTVFNPIADIKEAEMLKQGVELIRQTSEGVQYLASLEQKMTGATQYGKELTFGMDQYAAVLTQIKNQFPDMELPDERVARMDMPEDVQEILDNSVFGKGQGDGAFYDESKQVFRQKLQKHGIQHSTVILAKANERMDEVKHLAQQSSLTTTPKESWDLSNAILTKIAEGQEMMIELLAHLVRVQAAALYEGVDSYEVVGKGRMTRGQQMENELRNMRFKPREKIECEENMKKAGWCS